MNLKRMQNYITFIYCLLSARHFNLRVLNKKRFI